MREIDGLARGGRRVVGLRRNSQQYVTVAEDLVLDAIGQLVVRHHENPVVVWRDGSIVERCSLGYDGDGRSGIVDIEQDVI